jgi:predicted nucleotidyltransferase
MPVQIEIPHEAVAAFCKQNRIRRLSRFGSVLRDDFRPDSDIDVLVEFEAGAAVGLFDVARMERELSRLLEREVDLRTPGDLSRYFRDSVVAMAEVQYERTG